MEILKILNELADEPSNKKKLEILKQHEPHLGLKEAFRLAYDSSLNFYLTSKNLVNWSDVTFPRKDPTHSLRDSFEVLEGLHKRVYTGNAAIEVVEALRGKISKEDDEVFLRILDRDLRCGATQETANKVWPGLIPTYEVMLCRDDDPKNRKNITFPAFGEKKADGMRINFHVKREAEGFHITAFSRNGKPVDCLNVRIITDLTLLMRNMPGTDVVFDGELLVESAYGQTLDRATGNGICNKAIRGTISDEERNMLCTVLWDWVPMEDFYKGFCSTPLEDRRRFLGFSWVKNGLPMLGSVRLAHSTVLTSWEDAANLYKKMVAQGEEGIIVKNAKSPWEAKRSKHWIKFKEVLTIDLKIVAWEKGTGKNADKMGALICENLDGSIRTNVGTGFSDEMRGLDWNEMIGKIAEVQYNAVIEAKDSITKSLFLPRFVRIREDKNEPN